MPRGAGVRRTILRVGFGSTWIVAAACAPAERALETACLAAPVVYGEDGRRDLNATDPWYALAGQSVVALVERTLAEDLVAGRIDAASLSARASHALCEDEPFAEQPSIAQCTGVLLAPDLVLTAGHCVARGNGCDDLLYVTGFMRPAGSGRDDAAQTSPVLADFASSQLHECAEVLVRKNAEDARGTQRDYALVRLTEPAIALGRQARLRETEPQLGEPVVLLGHPADLPLKIDGGGQVIEHSLNDGTWFGADIDSFGGSSGGPVFDAHGALLGIAVLGLSDFVYDETRGCHRSNVQEANREGGTFERVAEIGALLADACVTGVAPACELLEAADRNDAIEDACR